MLCAFCPCVFGVILARMPYYTQHDKWEKGRDVIRISLWLVKNLFVGCMRIS